MMIQVQMEVICIAFIRTSIQVQSLLFYLNRALKEKRDAFIMSHSMANGNKASFCLVINKQISKELDKRVHEYNEITPTEEKLRVPLCVFTLFDE